jgi:hypothetical protein
MVRWISSVCLPINAVRAVVCAAQSSAGSAVTPSRGLQDLCARVAESRSRRRLFAVLSATG